MSRFKIIIALILLITFVCSLNGCGCAGAAAKINGATISRQTVDNILAGEKKKDPKKFEGEKGKTYEKSRMNDILDQLIDDELYFLAVQELKIAITDKEVNERVDNIAKSYKSSADFEKYYQGLGYPTRDDFAEMIRRSLAREKVIWHFVSVSDEEAKSYYSEHQDEFKDANTGEVLPYDKVVDRVKNTLITQKEQTKLKPWWNSFKNKKKIQKYI